jgi:predicted Zn-dependent protease
MLWSGMRLASFVIFCATLAGQNLSLNQEAALGKELAKQVRRSTTAVESQAIQDFVLRLGATVAAQAPKGKFPLTFSVVNGLESPLHGPVVLPGGNIFVPISLLISANDEAEFAGMLAQAIARGSVVVTSSEKSIPLIFYGGFPNGSTLIPVVALEQLRQMELQADSLAAPALSSAGYDPTALIRYIDRVQTSDPIFSPLPPRAVRTAALERTIRELPSRATYIEDSSAFSLAKGLARAEHPVPERPHPTLNSRPVVQ